MTTPKSNSEVADIMYRDPEILAKSLKPSVVSSINTLRDATGMSETQADAHLAETALVLHDARISGNEATMIADLINRTIAKPPEPETVDGWAVETRRMMREQFGDQADRRMILVREFLATQPTLSETLESTGLSAHPRIIRALCEHADNLRTTPRT